jgi:hypothetical protein
VSVTVAEPRRLKLDPGLVVLSWRRAGMISLSVARATAYPENLISAPLAAAAAGGTELLVSPAVAGSARALGPGRALYQSLAAR